MCDVLLDESARPIAQQHTRVPEPEIWDYLCHRATGPADQLVANLSAVRQQRCDPVMEVGVVQQRLQAVAGILDFLLPETATASLTM